MIEKTGWAGEPAVGRTVPRAVSGIALGDRARILAGRMFLHVGVVTATYPTSAMVDLECGDIVAVAYGNLERLPPRRPWGAV